MCSFTHLKLLFPRNFLYNNHQDATAILAVSRQSEVWSPELTAWEGPVLQAIDMDSPVTQEILEKQKAEGKEENAWNKGGVDEPGFIDPDFPPSDESLGMKQEVPKEWVRAIYLRGHQEQPVLFEDMEPASVCQGGIGDCWLIAAIASVAEFPSHIKDHLFSVKEVSQEGRYDLRLYDWLAGEWKTVTVDDRIPCCQRKGLEPRPYPLFARVPDREVYVPILEKAFAKFAGSYKALESGHSALAWMAMTGETRILYWSRKYSPPKWSIGKEGVLVRKDCSTSAETLGRLGKSAGVEELDRDGYFIKYKKLWGDGPKEGWFSLYLQGKMTATCFEDHSDGLWECKPFKWDTSGLNFHYRTTAESCEKQDNDAMWSKIREYDDANYLMGASFVSARSRLDGLVSGHAYSIIHAVEIEGLQLVCCRNPWGRHEWNGPWSDGSAEWTAHPAVAETLHVSDKQDGLFWMDWQTFSQIFMDIGVCPKSMPSKRADFDALRRSQELASQQEVVCNAAHVAYVLVAEVLGTTGAPTPWGANVPGAAAELLTRASSGSENLDQLLDAAAAQRAPAKVGLRDLCAALFKEDLGLSQLLHSHGLTAEGLRGALQASGQSLVPPPGASAPVLPLMQRERPKGASDEEDDSSSILERFGKDLVAEAAAGRLDTVFGREKEVQRVLHVLARRNKPNVCLLGPPGVGKTALVEEVARRIHLRQDLPRQLMGCQRLIQLSLGSLVGGTRYRGEFEKRMEKLLKELAGLREEVILFIDEIHMALGAGETEKGSSMDAANLLKPALARGELRCIGATTTAEYKKLIQNQDKAFERRFVIVELSEPTEAAAEEMLMAMCPAFESQRFPRHIWLSQGDGQKADAIETCFILAVAQRSNWIFPVPKGDDVHQIISALKAFNWETQSLLLCQVAMKVRFSVVSLAPPGVVLAVSGSCASLGRWSVAEAVPLVPRLGGSRLETEPDFHVVEVEIAAESDLEEIEMDLFFCEF
eukprot:s239_g16.t1